MQIANRQLIFGRHRIQGDPAHAGAAPYVLAGQQMYALGFGSGEIGPIGAEHLIGEMGGIWAHPCKVADGIEIGLADDAGAPLPAAPASFSEQLDEIAWSWASGPVHALRRDRVLPNAAAYAVELRLENTGATTAAGAAELRAPLRFLGCWFGGVATGRPGFRQAGNLVLGEDGLRPEWGVALGATQPPDSCAITPGDTGAEALLRYGFRLGPGEAIIWHFLLAAGLRGGAAEAEEQWRTLISPAVAFFSGATSVADIPGLPRLRSADATLERDAALAQANLQLLSANYPDLGPFFLAGLPEYPQLFGCDVAYSVPGAVAGGFAATTRSSIETLLRYAERACGRVPHEITTNGRVFNPGNIQETPQLTIAVWDYLRWTGDLAFARRVFPACREGMMELVPAHFGGLQYYPLGDGMVERLGMGSRKLDSACYYIAGLRALASIARALGLPDADGYEHGAAEAHAAFEQDWWIEEEGLYADSMHSDGRLQLDGHWTAVLPLQLGLAAPERAARVMARLEADFVNEWGLVHTRVADERVWTLPTGLMALACFQQGRAERGLQLTRNIAATAEHGTLGTFKELIPEGLCFVQLWSAGLFLQAIVEGLLGLSPDAPAHALAVDPCMPADAPSVRLEELRVGEHTISLTISPRALRLEHLQGPQPLAVRYAGTTVAVAPGSALERQR